MRDRAFSRPTVLVVALLLLSAVLVMISVSESRADSHELPADTDEIVLVIGADGNSLEYGPTSQPLVAGSSNCKLTDASVEGPIMTITANSVDNKGNPKLDSPIGLVDDGLGTSPRGNGNGQDCGLVDHGEDITFTLTPEVGSRLIQSMSLDLEGKFGGGALVTYLLNGVEVGHDHLAMSEKGSDNGPDAREGDNYYFETLPEAAENVGILFNGVRIEPDPEVEDPGSVSVQSGTDWPDPSANLTVFNLISATDCGDSVETGGPFETDDPLASFFVGPTKGGEPCAVPISLTTTNTTSEEGGEQTVVLEPPDGFSWEGVGISGLLTIVWDIEVPDGDPIDRTYFRTVVEGAEVNTVIPWCEDIIPYEPSGDGWSYTLSEDEDNPSGRYPNATDVGLCLIDQSTETVFYDHDEDPETDNIWTQTTEIFYIFEDPTLVRF